MKLHVVAHIYNLHVPKQDNRDRRETLEAVSLAWYVSSEQLGALPKLARQNVNTWTLQLGRIQARHLASGAFNSSSAVG